MIKTFKKYIKLSIISLLLLCLVGCSNNRNANTDESIKNKEYTIEEILDNSAKAQEQIENFNFNLNLLLNLSSKEEDITMSLDFDVDMIMDPYALRGNVSLDLGTEPISYLMYMKENGDYMDVYSSVSFDGDDYWEHSTEEISNNTFDFSIAQNLKYDAENYSLVGKEIVDGEELYHLLLTVSGSEFSNIFNSLGNLDDDLNINIFGNLFDAIDEVEYNIWINAHNWYLTKIEVDAVDLLNSLMGSLLSGADISIDQYLIEMSYHNINEIDEIEIPQEALNATSTDLEI